MARGKKSAPRESKTRAREEAPGERVPTGVAGLDMVLHGGLRPGQLYVITGEPGTGKTVLSSELAFRRAARGENAAIVSFMSEPHSELVRNLSPLSFFDQALITDRKVTLLSASRPIAEEGVDGLLTFLRAALTQTGAKLLVIEGLRAIETVAQTAIAAKRFLGELSSLGSMMGCTIVCTVVREVEIESWPEQIMADGVFALGREKSGLRRNRTFQVMKFRGSSHLEGVHTATINEEGFCIVPRLESRVRNLRDAPVGGERLGFDIPPLDEMMRGGVVECSSTGILGAPGSGKTLLGLHFLAAGCARGEPAVHFGFYESPARLLAKARGVGLGLERFAKKGLLEIVWQPAIEEPLDIVASRLLDAVERRGVRRLFIDGIDAFEVTAMHPERLMRFLAALAAELRSRGVTTLLSQETALLDQPVKPVPRALSTIYDDIVLLRYLELHGALYRLVSILKMRESDYDSSVRELFIAPSGITLAATPESAAEILAEKEPSRADRAAKPKEERIHAPLKRTRRRA